MTHQSKEEIRGQKTLEVDFSIFAIFGVLTPKNLKILEFLIGFGQIKFQFNHADVLYSN